MVIIMGKEYLNISKTKLPSLLKKNCKWFFFCGSRSMGKTWAVHIHAVEEFLKNKRILIKIVRKNDDIKPTAEALFDGVGPMYYPNLFPLIKTVGIFKMVYLCKKDEAGELIPIYGEETPFALVVSLRARNSLKTVSTTFSFIDRETKKKLPLLFYFDEFQVEGQADYLPDEVGAFLSVYQTINRDRVDSYGIFTSNSLSILCPLFSEFGIDKLLSDSPDLNFYYDSNKNFMLQRFNDDRFVNLSQDEALKAFENHEYLKTSLNNEFLDSKTLIKNLDKLPYKRLLSFISSENINYSIEIIKNDYFNGLYVSNRGNYEDNIILSSSIKTHSFNTFYSGGRTSSIYINALRDCFNGGDSICFKDLKTKAAFVELIGYKNKK